MSQLTQLKEILSGGSHFVLLGHLEPDGDAVGSMLALSALLISLGKKTTLVLKDPVPAIFNFLVENRDIQPDLPAEFDGLILVDNGDLRRTGIASEINELKKKNFPIIHFDHHQKSDLWRLTSLNYCDDQASSTAEIIFGLFASFKIEISPEIATALLAGIFNDTGGFRHSNTSEKVLNIVAELLRRGGKLKKIADNIENSHSIARFKLWGTALNRLTLNKTFGISWSYLSWKDLKEVGATEEEISGLVNLLNSAPESKASMLLYEDETGKIKGSLRSESNEIDLAKLAELLGGGGHKKAAGFMIDGRTKIENNHIKII